MRLFWERRFGGHICIGRLVIYGENAMHWGVRFWTRRWGYVCFRLPFRCFGHWWPLYFYLSPNATPWGATLLIGREYSRGEKMMARVRKALWGHGYSDRDPHSPVDYCEPILRQLPSDFAEAYRGERARK